MAKFDKIAVLNKIGSTGMVPVFYHKDAEIAKKVVKAMFSPAGIVLSHTFASILTYNHKGI